MLIVCTIASAQTPDVSSRTVPTVRFDVPDTTFTSSGSIKMDWDVSDTALDRYDLEFELQQSGDSAFADYRVRYLGPDLASYISGLKDGTYYYRVRVLKGGHPGDWSRTVVVTVEHHSLKLAFTLFGLGAFVFVATVVVVFSGVRRDPRSSSTGREI
ncbi:MAG: hypothetical protein JW763_00515 [candidate division Zixibacteria bacterium]|nr:hypothetical protein [candidate division Zixibacteria bacterium]